MSNEMYIARSTDDTIREKGESGGAVTSILKCALETKEVDAVITVSSKDGSRFAGIPVLVTNADDLDKTAGALHCSIPNTVRFLKEYLEGGLGKKIAFVGKPCDIRGVIELQKRYQIEIDGLILIGLNCTGTISPATARKMYETEFKVDPSDVVREDIDEGVLTITLRDGKTKSKDLAQLEKKGLGRRENCQRCEINIPTFADIACGKWGTENEEIPSTFIEVYSSKGNQLIEHAIKKGYITTEKPSSESIALRQEKDRTQIESALAKRENDFGQIMAMSYDERLSFWVDEFEKCIKCYGCRDACPICYCDLCLLEANRNFLEAGVIPPNALFPLTRLAHVGDSCVNCGQCQDACPMELPLSLLFSLQNYRMSEVFDYVSGTDIQQGPPLNTAMDEELMIDDVFLDVSELTKNLKK